MAEIPKTMNFLSQSEINSSIKREEFAKNEAKRKMPQPRPTKTQSPTRLAEDQEDDYKLKQELLRKITAYRNTPVFADACRSTRQVNVQAKSTMGELLYVYDSIRSGISSSSGIEPGRNVLKNMLLQLEGLRNIFPTLKGLGEKAAQSIYTEEGEKLLWEWQIEKNGFGLNLTQNLYIKTLLFFGVIAWSVHLSNSNPSYFQACRMEMMEDKTSKQ